MSTVYYHMTYGQYKEHAHKLHGGEVVGHSDDEVLTDTSIVVLKVSHYDHVHYYLEQQGIQSLPKTHPRVSYAASKHPLMKVRE